MFIGRLSLGGLNESSGLLTLKETETNVLQFLGKVGIFFLGFYRQTLRNWCDTGTGANGRKMAPGVKARFSNLSS